MIAYCPRCGAPFPFEIAWEFARASLRCRDCGLAPTEPPSVLAPAGEEVEYDLAGWPMTGRVAASAALVEVDIPYRWEAELVLAVPAAVEQQVDRLLEACAGDDALEAGDADLEGQDDEGDGGEEAQAAMADLFLAADRLQHAPWDQKMGDELVGVAAKVNSCLPPYGIERPVWGQIQGLASALVSSLREPADDDVARRNARALRDVLRNYV